MAKESTLADEKKVAKKQYSMVVIPEGVEIRLSTLSAKTEALFGGKPFTAYPSLQRNAR